MSPSSSTSGFDDWQGALAARYPLARSAGGFGCFGGWFSILAHLFERLEAAAAELPTDRRRDFKVEQIKQKFGSLVVYLSQEGTAEMQAAIAEARSASVITCEVCGAPGDLAERRGWLSVKCPRHENWSHLDEVV
jgi:hypothetical protein